MLGLDNESGTSKHLQVIAGFLKMTFRGWDTLSSSDPSDPPRFDPNYLSSTEDFAHLIKTVQVSTSPMSTDALKSIGI